MKYRKKPVVIEAIQYNGINYPEIFNWAHAGMPPEANSIVTWSGCYLEIRTLEGLMPANVGDFIIKGVANEFYVCKPDIFEQTYEKVEDSNAK